MVYAIENAPSGMTIDSATGVIAWTPTQAQIGAQTFSLKLTDKAGNTKTQSLSINVIEQPLAKVILEVVDMSGNPITQIGTGSAIPSPLPDSGPSRTRGQGRIRFVH